MLMNAHKALKTVPSDALTPLDLSSAPAMLDTGWLVTEGRAMVSWRNKCIPYDCTIYYSWSLFWLLSDINECTGGADNCAQRCTNTAGSYTCSCNSGFTLGADGRSCTADPVSPLCGGRLTTASGSFQTPGWPTSYPLDNFQCEWIITLPNTGATIEFTVDDSAYGINGRDPCSTDHIQFFDGTGGNAGSLLKLCGHRNFYDFTSITTTSSQARVVFTGSSRARPASRVGVKVDYRTVTVTSQSEFACGKYPEIFSRF